MKLKSMDSCRRLRQDHKFEVSLCNLAGPISKKENRVVSIVQW